MNEKIKRLIIAETEQKIREILPQIVREIALRRIKEHIRDQEALHFQPWDDHGNDYY
jgi:hypothetical protein